MRKPEENLDTPPETLRPESVSRWPVPPRTGPVLGNPSDDIPAAAASLEQAERLRSQGAYIQAEALYAAAIEHLERALGHSDAQVADAVLRLAGLRCFMNLHDEAFPLYDRALRILETSLGASHPRVAELLLEIADVYLDQPDDDHPPHDLLSEQYYRRALDILEKHLGANHPVADTHPDRLAVLYDLQGKIAEAESLHQWALGVLTEQPGTDPLRLGAQMLRWARFCMRRGRFEEGIPVTWRALKVAEETLGAEHPDLRTYLYACADLCIVWDIRDMLDFRSAQRSRAPRMDIAHEKEALYLRALAIDEKTFGKDHPAVVKPLMALESLHHSLDRYKEAHAFRRRILAIVDRVGANRPIWAVETLLRLRELGPGEPAPDADALLERALPIAERSSGADELAQADTNLRFARLHLEEGRVEKAGALFERARALTANALGPDHPRIACFLLRTGLGYFGRNNVIAQRNYDEAIAILRRISKIEDPTVARQLLSFVDSYEVIPPLATGLPLAMQFAFAELPPQVDVDSLKAPDPAQLLQVLRPALEKGFGPDHAIVGSCLLGLAHVHIMQGEETDAEHLFLNVLRIGEKNQEQDSDLAVAAVSALAMLYHIQKKYAAAEPLYRRWLASCETHPDPQELSLLTPLFNLAQCCVARGHRHEAEPLFRRAMGILEARRASFGADVNPDVYMQFYRLLGSDAEAETLLRRELSTAEEMWGRDGFFVESPLSDLADICRRRGNFAEAERLYQRVIASCEDRIGPDGATRLAPLLTGLARVYIDQGGLVDALPLVLRAITLLQQVRKRTGEEDEWLLGAMQQQASVLRRLGREAEAREVESAASPVRIDVETAGTRRLREAVRHRLTLDWAVEAK